MPERATPIYTVDLAFPAGASKFAPLRVAESQPLPGPEEVRLLRRGKATPPKLPDWFRALVFPQPDLPVEPPGSLIERELTLLRDQEVRVEPDASPAPFWSSARAFWLVSRPLRDVIEGLEPGVHAFYRARLHRHDGALTNEERFGLAVRRRLAAIDTERTDVHAPRYDERGRLIDGYPPSEPDAARVMRAEVVAGRHLWVDAAPLTGLGGQAFCSGEFRARVRAERLTGLRFTKTDWQVLPAIRTTPKISRI